MPRLCCAVVLVDGGRLTRIGTAYEYVSGHRTWGACRRDERLQQVLAPVVMLHQLSSICGMVYRTDRFERGVGQRQEIRILTSSCTRNRA